MNRIQEVLENESYCKLLTFIEANAKQIIYVILVGWLMLIMCIFTLIFSCVAAVRLAMLISM